VSALTGITKSYVRRRPLASTGNAAAIRRFPRPWTVEETFESEPGRRSAAKLQPIPDNRTHAKRRRIAANIAKLPELLRSLGPRKPHRRGRGLLSVLY
jgi:hypothetical protein